ncbi:hypothetical protein DR64_5467 [Paraburkholderia xenovorans LB400]|uniref:hypothetical protein n=1 Tax=Paraburkholderia xenovorans TaxID=36873 RepID=UPI000325EC3F|nr:hypothetical protein [Paraburkholderia xenovorans]AIP35625.1 hypothetical protein DR64_5467 [Paraburkholderia xenovorans LB400]
MKPLGTEGNSDEAQAVSPALVSEVDERSSSGVVREIEIQAEVLLPEGGVELIDAKIEEVETPAHDGQRHHHSHEGEHGHLVEVTVDNREVRVKKGAYVVAAFKAVVGVAADRVLDRILGPGKFEELVDDQTIHVHAGEVFISHVKQGSSS